jgi:hypothetical protein
MNNENPPVCSAWLPLPDARAACELPVGHAGPHRAANPPNTPEGRLIFWSGLPRRQLPVRLRDLAPGAA